MEKTVRIVWGLAVVVFLAASLAYGQTAPQEERGKTIFDFKKDLNLTDKQEQEIRTILADLNKEVRITQAKLTLIDADLEDLTKKEGDLEQIRKKLKEAADLQAAIRFSDIEASRKINRVLSPEQLKRWRGIQAAQGRR